MQPPNSQYTAEFQPVDPTWVLKALGVTLAVALILAYLTICVVFSHKQWQLVLHPSRETAQTPASPGLNFTEVRFGVDASGEPQLDGWWIPSDRQGAKTVLMLHGASGSMTDALPTARILHEAHLNVFLFDYRGYGKSGGAHPSEAWMQEDAHSALNYLRQTREIPVHELVMYGRDLGASLALQLCATGQIECPAMILDAPDGDLLPRVLHDTRAAVVPVSLLFKQRFPLAEPLRVAMSPKLIFTYTSSEAPLAVRDAADPKMTVELRAGDATAYLNSVERFLDEHNPKE